MRLHEKDFPSTTWHAREAPRLYRAGEPGGLVAMQAASGRTRLEARDVDARPSLPLPSE